MPLTQLAVVAVTIISYALVVLGFAFLYKRMFGYKEVEFYKINFAVNLTMLLCLLCVGIAIVLYFFKILN